MWYFAYGSNLLAVQMTARTGLTFSDVKPKRARLPGYRVAFNAAGENGCTYANILQPGDGAIGAIYWCTEDALKLLDKFESGYDRVRVEVIDEADWRVEAVAYIARPENVSEAGRPTAEYVDRIVRGAREHGIEEQYVRGVETAAGRIAEPAESC